MYSERRQQCFRHEFGSEADQPGQRRNLNVTVVSFSGDRLDIRSFLNATRSTWEVRRGRKSSLGNLIVRGHADGSVDDRGRIVRMMIYSNNEMTPHGSSSGDSMDSSE
jgi:hypothetical protein